MRECVCVPVPVPASVFVPVPVPARVHVLVNASRSPLLACTPLILVRSHVSPRLVHVFYVCASVHACLLVLAHGRTLVCHTLAHILLW